jgi:chemotaxis protein MotB
MPRQRVPEPEKDKSERWLLTYADMITLLLALFVVLFSTSRVDQVKFEQVAGSLQRAFNVPVLDGSDAHSAVSLGHLGNTFVGLTGVGATIGPELISYAQQQELGDQISVTASKDALVITLNSAFPFAPGSAELRPDAVQGLNFIAGTLKDLPDHNLIRIEGHTDSQPPNSGQYPSNWDLSAARAGAAARILEAAGVDKNRLITVGYADTRPLADNATPEGRSRNRRIEIWVVDPETVGPLAAPIAPAAG